MERAVFAEHLAVAAQAACEFASGFLEEALPGALTFRVHLNSSYDGNAKADVKRFPEDSSDERALATKQLDAAGVVDLLWRDGHVPEWIDISVAGVAEQQTIVDLTSCGRFAGDEARLYYAQTKCAPFGVKGPALPVEHVEGQRFSVYDRSSCWSSSELESVRQNAGKVWSLALHGPAFDGLPLGAATFSRLSILELCGVRVERASWSALARMPAMRHLRVRPGPVANIDLSSLPELAQLETFTLRNLPPAFAGTHRLAEAAPRLQGLELHAAQPVSADGSLFLPNIERLTLELAELPPWLLLPRTLRGLTLRVPAATDERMLTQSQVAKRLGKSVATVRRVDGVLLVPQQDARASTDSMPTMSRIWQS